MISTTIGGVSAAPKRDPACVMPCANPRSVGRIQRDSERVAIGNALTVALDAAYGTRIRTRHHARRVTRGGGADTADCGADHGRMGLACGVSGFRTARRGVVGGVVFLLSRHARGAPQLQ